MLEVWKYLQTLLKVNMNYINKKGPSVFLLHGVYSSLS